jgi:hypothetical protein
MILQVESSSAHAGDQEPVTFSLGARRLEVLRIVDRWPAAGHVYFKVAADDGATYILRNDEATHQWELTLYQSPGMPS